MPMMRPCQLNLPNSPHLHINHGPKAQKKPGQKCKKPEAQKRPKMPGPSQHYMECSNLVPSLFPSFAVSGWKGSHDFAQWRRGQADHVPPLN